MPGGRGRFPGDKSENFDRGMGRGESSDRGRGGSRGGRGRRDQRPRLLNCLIYTTLKVEV